MAAQNVDIENSCSVIRVSRESISDICMERNEDILVFAKGKPWGGGGVSVSVFMLTAENVDITLCLSVNQLIAAEQNGGRQD